MAKCIPYVYGKADREILDVIETERDKNMNGNFLQPQGKNGRDWQILFRTHNSRFL